MAEEWRDAVGFPGYMVSSLGRIKSDRRKASVVLKPSPNEGGYLHVSLMVNGRAKTVLVHKLVAEAFLGQRPDNCPHTRHLDSDQTNNSAVNLAYGTVSENQMDAVRRGSHSRLKLTQDQVDEIRSLYAKGEHSHRALAKIFGVNHSSIGAIIRRQGGR